MASASAHRSRRRNTSFEDTASATGDAGGRGGGGGYGDEHLECPPFLTPHGYLASGSSSSNNLWPLLTVAVTWAVMVPVYLLEDIDISIMGTMALICSVGAAIVGFALMAGGVRTRDNCVKDSLVLSISHAAIFAYVFMISEKNNYKLGAQAFGIGLLCEVIGGVSHVIYLNEYSGSRYTLLQNQAMIAAATFIVIVDVIRYFDFLLEPASFAPVNSKSHRAAYMYVALVVLQAAMGIIKLAIYAKTAPSSITKVEAKAEAEAAAQAEE